MQKTAALPVLAVKETKSLTDWVKHGAVRGNYSRSDSIEVTARKER